MRISGITNLQNEIILVAKNQQARTPGRTVTHVDQRQGGLMVAMHKPATNEAREQSLAASHQLKFNVDALPACQVESAQAEPPFGAT